MNVDRPTEFELKIRIPSWAKTVSVNGEKIEKSDYYSVNKCWNGTESFTVSLTDAPHFILRPYNLMAVEYGALIFALPIKAEYKKHEYIKDGVERKYPYCDYELIPHSQWRYGFCGEDITVCERKGDNIPFSSSKPSIVLKTKLCRVEWDYADGYDTVADKQPLSNKAIGEPLETELYPYGCAKLRMTEMPLIGQRDNF